MKKGFTLAELLGVIIILGIIALIITPVVTKTISDSEDRAYNKQVDMIKNVAKEWGVENIDKLPDVGSTTKISISLETLLASGKIQNSTIIDPRSGNEMTGCVVVSYNTEYNQYEYSYNEDSTYCESLNN